MTDKSRTEQIVRWARFVRDNPINSWKPQHSEFIDSRLEVASGFYARLATQPGGHDIIKKLRELRAAR